MTTIVIRCATDHCPNYQRLFTDETLPKRWLCSICEDALTAQMLDDLERRQTAPYNFDRPIKRMADFQETT